MCARWSSTSAVDHLAAAPVAAHHAGRLEHPQVLADQRLGDAEGVDQLVHARGGLAQLQHDRDPHRRGQRAQQVARGGRVRRGAGCGRLGRRRPRVRRRAVPPRPGRRRSPEHQAHGDGHEHHEHQHAHGPRARGQSRPRRGQQPGHPWCDQLDRAPVDAAEVRAAAPRALEPPRRRERPPRRRPRSSAAGGRRGRCPAVRLVAPTAVRCRRSRCAARRCRCGVDPAGTDDVRDAAGLPVRASRRRSPRRSSPAPGAPSPCSPRSRGAGASTWVARSTSRPGCSSPGSRP